MPTASECNNGRCFPPDVRNLGGRRTIVDNLYCHRVKLSEIKPTLHVTKPMPPPKKDETWLEFLQQQQAIETGKTFASIYKQKSAVTTTYEEDVDPQVLSARISRNRRASNQSTDYEHRIRIANMQRRIHEYHSATERKKNPFDTTVYPSYIMRRVKPKPSTAREGERRQKSARSDRSDRSFMDALITDASNLSLQRGLGSTRPNTTQTARSHPLDFYDSSPSVRGSSRDSARGYLSSRGQQQTSDSQASTVHDLHKRIVEKIVARRLYQTKDLENLFDEEMQANEHLDKTMVLAAINEIRADLRMGAS